MNHFRAIALLFLLAAVLFAAGTVNHLLHTGEGIISSLLLAAACLCGAVTFWRLK